MPEFKGAALVTGSAKRLGKAIALKLAEMGFDIALHFHSSKKDAEQTRKEIEAKGKKCFLFQADLGNVEQLSRLLTNVYKQLPELNLLVNSASVFKKVSLIDSTLADFEDNFNVHVRAPYVLIRDFAKHCSKGQVINIVDANVVHNETNYSPYLLSKKALFQLSEMAACELAPKIRVNSIGPGLILAPEKEQLQQSDNLLEHGASTDDLTLAVEYLINNEHVTGQCLFVDGGDHLIRLRNKQVTPM